MFDTTLFNANISPISSTSTKSLVLSGCKVIFPNETVYSELDELNYYDLNNNDYGFGRTDIELSFDDTFQDAYSEFFIRCVSIRLDNEILCKTNCNPMPRQFLPKNYTKITKEGKMALGISYHFTLQEERTKLLRCKSFCIEGFVALNRKTNTYGFMCCVQQTADGWILQIGNTYRIYNKININSLWH